MSSKLILTTAQAAKYASFSTQKIRELIKAGKLPAVNTSTTDNRERWSIRLCDLEEFLTPVSVAKSQAKQTAASRRQRIDANVPKVYS